MKTTNTRLPMPTRQKILIASATACVLSAAILLIFGYLPCIPTDIETRLFPKDPEEIKCQPYRPGTVFIEITETQFIKWTSDGSKIIFDFDSNRHLDHSTWSTSHHGNNLTKLADAKPYNWITDEEKGTGYAPYHGTHADLSPDGTTLAYTVCDNNRQDLQFPDDHLQGSFDIAITRMDGEKPIVIAPKDSEGQDQNQEHDSQWQSSLYQGYPSWSPEGKQIAFIQEEGDAYFTRPEPWATHMAHKKLQPTLFIADIEKDGTLSNMLHKEFEELQSAQPLWAPDGSHIAVMTQKRQTYTWQVQVLRTSDMRALSEPIGTSTTTASWSPDSTKLAFAHYSTEEDPDKPYQKTHHPYLEIAHLDGSPNTRIQLGEIPPVAAIAWHPDGSEILLGTRSLYAVNVQDHSMKELIPEPEYNWNIHGKRTNTAITGPRLVSRRRKNSHQDGRPEKPPQLLPPFMRYQRPNRRPQRRKSDTHPIQRGTTAKSTQCNQQAHHPGGSIL